MANSYNDLYSTYWSTFQRQLLSCEPPFEPRTPLGGEDQSRYAVISTNNRRLWVKLEVACSVTKHWIFVQIVLMKDEKWQRYNDLKAMSQELEAGLHERGIHERLDWEPKPLNDTPRIRISNDEIDLLSRSDWPMQHKWLIDRLIGVWEVFADHVSELR